MKKKEGEAGAVYSKDLIMQAPVATKDYAQKVQAALPAHESQYGDTDEFKYLSTYTGQTLAIYGAGREPKQNQKSAYLDAVSKFEAKTGKKLVEQPVQTQVPQQTRVAATESALYTYGGELKGKVDWADAVLSAQLDKLKTDVGSNADAKIRAFVDAAAANPGALPVTKPADPENFIAGVISQMGQQ